METAHNLEFVRRNDICKSPIYLLNLTEEEIKQLRKDGLRELQIYLNSPQIRN